MISEDETQRRKFEKWISSEPLAMSIVRNPENPAVSAWPGQYKEWIVQIAWEAWQEALRV